MASVANMPKDVFLYLLEFLIYPRDDPLYVAAAANHKKLHLFVKPNGSVGIDGRWRNKYRGEHPESVLQRELRKFAQVEKYCKIVIYEYRRTIRDQLCAGIWSPFHIDFLWVEKNMTKQASKHRKCLKQKATRPKKRFQLEQKSIRRSAKLAAQIVADAVTRYSDQSQKKTWAKIAGSN